MLQCGFRGSRNQSTVNRVKWDSGGFYDFQLECFVKNGCGCYQVLLENTVEEAEDWMGNWTTAKKLCESLSTLEVPVYIAGMSFKAGLCKMLHLL